MNSYMYSNDSIAMKKMYFLDIIDKVYSKYLDLANVTKDSLNFARTKNGMLYYGSKSCSVIFQPYGLK